MKAGTIPVSIRAYLCDGRDGWLVAWKDGDKQRRYFVLTRSAAKEAKSRAKAGKLPKTWAVRIRN